MALELLSPAGSPEALRAAVQSGCGAVYLGWGAFNARRGAKNFTDEEFAAAIRYCHVRGVRVFLTLNTLVTDRELPAALDAARTACRLGVDSVLVQDWGLFSLLRETLPDLPLHASTQMSLFTSGGANEVYHDGCERVVLARECSREDIAAVCRACPAEVEVFGHGALCMCYSGQCAFSALIGGRSGVMVMFLIATAMNFISYWFSDTMVLKAYRAQEVGEDHYLYRIVADLAQRADLPMPKVYIIPTEVPNAFATGRSPSHAAVAATAGILDLLDEDEIRGVLAHEMSHILHRDILISTIVACFASAIGMIANIAQWAAIFGGGRDDDGEGNPVALLVTAIVAPLAASIIQLGISRTREYMADEEGGRMIDDPIALARALAKIDNYAHHYALPGATKATAHMCIINPFAGAGSAIANLFSTHPPTEKRIERLEELDKELHD